ncbi:hypothetical protein EZV62_008782 [Acer yangbiense]|uniref:Glycosyltransferase 61 catalytic domain-containing protein n=1 Tax=Acer yangbiense TaxID=1000413 RepID=A0A5C7IDX4_9ROSI|nr:hypothetical protein EZV62_008782 [Acer yangbiense]
MVQVVLLGLEWGSTAYYGGPASDMGVQYLEYKIDPEESTLLKKFGRDHPIITDPDSIGTKGYYAFRSVYINGQNVDVNLTSFLSYNFSDMGKKLKVELVFGATTYSVAFLLLLVWFFAAAYFYVNPLGSCKHQLRFWRDYSLISIKKGDFAIEEVLNEVIQEDTLKFQLRRFVRDEDRIQFESTGFSCLHSQISEVCVSERPLIIDNQTIYVPSSQLQLTKKVKLYGEVIAHHQVSPVQIVAGEQSANSSVPACHVTHDVPAVVFSGRGLAGNMYHEISEMIIPLFITTRHFRSQVKFVITDFNPKWVKKYSKVLESLSGYDVINPAENGTVHCFPGGVMGLKYYGLMALNSSDLPGGYSMADFRKFLRESYSLKYENVVQIKRERPVLLLISRKNSRVFLNELEMVALMEEIGFEVVVVRPSGMSNLAKFTRVVNTCSVMVGAHGAGLTNEVFLPSGAVMVQVVLLGVGFDHLLWWTGK